jgi:signal transduction histidine kinase
MAVDSDEGVGPTDALLVLLDEVRHAERHATSSRVAAVIGHLIGTPLNVISGRAGLIRADPESAGVADHAARIEDQAHRLAQRIRHLIEYLTAPVPGPTATPLATVVADAMSLYQPIAAHRDVDIQLDASSLPDVDVDSISTLVTLTSLLSIGARSAPKGATLKVAVSPASGNHIAIEVEIPGLKPPTGRIDRLEPPEDDPVDPELMQVLSVCFAMLRRVEGRLEIHPKNDGSLVRLSCPTFAR